jgi:mannose-6-phosphate isomerase-like protein (cupin superfamily)
VDGSVLIIPAGTEHNVVNTSPNEPLRLYTIYSPPNHPDGTINKTKAEAEEYERIHHGH